MKFKYKGRNKKRKIETGFIEGNTRKDVIIKLKKTGIALLKLKEVEEPKSVFSKENKEKLQTFFKNQNLINISVYVGKEKGKKDSLKTPNSLMEESKGPKESLLTKLLKKLPYDEEISEIDVSKIGEDDFLQNLEEEKETEDKIEEEKEKTKTNILTTDINMEMIRNLMSKEDTKKKKRTRRKKVKVKEVMMFTKQFAVLLETGVPLVKGLQLMVQQTKNPYFQKALAVITTSVAKGHDLSFSMAKFPHIFNSYYITMIETGQLTGELSEVLNLLYDYEFNRQKLKNKIVSASIYPAIIFVVLIIAFIVSSVFMLPMFKEMFLDMELPMITKVVFGVLEFIGNNLHFIGAGFVFLILLFRYLLTKPELKYAFDFRLLKLPMIGVFLTEYQMTNILKTLSISLKNGIPLTRSLSITIENTTNTALKYELKDVLNRVVQGIPMSVAMQTKSVFPDLVTQMVRTGEESGKLQEIIDKTYSYYVWSVDAFVEKMSKWIEPVMIIFVAIFVVALVFAIALPMFSISSGETLVF